MIGFLGFGEAAFYMAKGLKSEGYPHLSAYDIALEASSPYKDTLELRAVEAGVTFCSSLRELVAGNDVLVIAVPAAYTAATAEEALRHARRGQLFVDVTTALPDVKEAEETSFSKKGADYVDSAMLGPLPVYAHKVPMLASGRGAKKWRDLMTPFGMSIELVDGQAGTASRIKLVRSVFMKGLEALLVETLLFARRCGSEKVVLTSIAETLNKVPFEKTVERMVCADTIHSERRSFEVAESIHLMREVGIEPVVASGVRSRLQRSAETGLAKELCGIAPSSIEDVFHLWEKKEYN